MALLEIERFRHFYQQNVLRNHIYMDLVLDNLRWLLSHNTKANQTIIFYYLFNNKKEI